MKTGNWNVHTLNRSGNTAQAAREMPTRDTEIMGISETHWTWQGQVHFIEGETIIYSGRDDNTYKGGGMLMSERAARALKDWTLVSERLIKARYYSKHIKLTIIHKYAYTEDAEKQVKDDFYMKLQDIIDSRNI